MKDEWAASLAAADEALEDLRAQIEEASQVLRAMYRLVACALCNARMAVPGQSLCVMCDATLPDSVPDTMEGI